MSAEKLAFEDFEPGRRFPLGPKPVTAEEIVEFAREFDPQPMHLDEAAGRASILGGLAASGWHTSAMLMRMMADSYILDAAEDVLRDWYVTRFFSLRDTAFRDPKSYFHRYASLTDKEANATANRIWETINLVNLRENVVPTRQRADLILRKGADHIIHSVWLRKL